jgi:TetR/AcrR family tetracycline transcriptional repressor
MRLERPMVVRAALELLNEVGLDGLTTRRLADSLGVQGPALYWHFKNKQELIDEMSRFLLSDSFGPIREGQDWTDWMIESARRLRRTMLSYRDSARLIAGYRPTGPHGRMDPEAFFGPLRDAGFPWPDAAWAAITMAQFTFGFTMDEQAAAGRGSLPPEKRLDSNQGFEFGIQTILEGLKARLAAHVQEPAPDAGWVITRT